MSFNATIQNIRDGALLELLTGKLSEVVEAVQEHGKSGSLSITLNIKPNGDDAVTISSSVKAKVPEGTVGDALFFVSGGNLVRRNPRQTDIEDEIARKRSEREAV
jgi:hypothetical protein